MCGIAGIAPSDLQRPVDRAALRRMTDALLHRGPDDEGFHVAPGIGLGFRRLSIVDLATGHQPIASEDGQVVVVCNGEIYNYVELRRELEAAGHVFSTGSDVETIVHLYEAHGDAFVHRLRGMFALALWDARDRRLVLARDRLGIKPLQYAITPTGLVFASEDKAILASGAVEAKMDLHALRQIFAYGRTATPRTFNDGVRKLPAGHLLVWSAGRAELRSYWEPSFPARDGYDRRTSAREWAETLRDKLAETVRIHLRSDVPVGSWLSGGVDSSSVTALMASMLPGPVETFTLRFDDASFDDLHGARALDDFPRFGLQGHRVWCGARDLERMPRAMWHLDHAFLGSICIGQLMVAEATAPHVKVVLAGEGADEILGGYSWYRTQRVLAPLFLLPPGARRAIARVPAVRRRWPGAAGTLEGPREMGFDRYSRSITHLGTASFGPRVFSDAVVDALAGHDEGQDAPPTPDGFERWHPFVQMQFMDLRHRLADGVVMGLDRASMAYSVEVRVPFLDHELVELCARIPPAVKMHWLREKDVLRRAMAALLPPEIAWRRKQPMRVPFDRWMSGPLPPFAAELLSEEALRETGTFDPRKVAEVHARHRAGVENMGQALCGVLGVQLWHRQHGREQNARPTLACATG